MEPNAGIKPGREKENRRKRYQCWRKERGVYNQRFISTYRNDFFKILFTMYKCRVCGEGTHSLAYTHTYTRMLHLFTQTETDTMNPLYFCTRDVHWNACQRNHLGCICNNILCWKYVENDGLKLISFHLNRMIGVSVAWNASLKILVGYLCYR